MTVRTRKSGNIEHFYPQVEELLGEEFCERAFGKDAQDWKSTRISPEKFICKAGPYLNKGNFWQEIWDICWKVLYSPNDDGNFLPSGKFFLWGGPEDQWLSKIRQLIIEKDF